MTQGFNVPGSCGTRLRCESFHVPWEFWAVGNFREADMSAYEMFVLAIAGANGGMIYYALRRREQMLAWVKARSRRR